MDGDLAGFHQSTISRVLTRVINAIADLRPQYIKFPTAEEIPQIKRRFYEYRGIPGVIGAVDGTHIPIQNPGGPDAELYRNRKGWYSINTQLLCDDRMLIRGVVASWYGSAHDARVFSDSNLRLVLEGIRRGHVLGDAGYPLRSYLMTPVAVPRTREEKAYNKAHSATRMFIERTIGAFKRRFPAMARKMRFGGEIAGVEKAANAIVACAVLYNFAKMRNDILGEQENGGNRDEDVAGVGNAYLDNAEGAAKRRMIIQNHFA